MISETTRVADTARNAGIAGPPSHEVPQFIRDLANSRLNRVNRHSRASSLVSVSTKFTNSTFNEDSRSIDLVIGGQFFRIARDGSRVTDSAPPPYSTIYTIESQSRTSPSLPATSPSASVFSAQTTSGESLDAAFVLSGDEDEDDDSRSLVGGFTTPRQQSPSRSPDTAIRTARVSFELATPTLDLNQSRPQTALAVDDDVPDRHPSYKSGVEVLNVVPRNSRVSRADDFARSPPLRRRNGVRLPSLDTFGRHTLGAPPGRQRSQSAGPILEPSLLEDDSNELRSSQPAGRRAFTAFPPLMLSRSAIQLDSHDDDDSEEDSRPPQMDTENDISLHYSGMMRRLDREHRKDSQVKDREISILKQQLEEKDHVYRQQFREMRYTIEDLQQQLEHMKSQLEENERSVENRIERAIFKTEDTWEQRWRDQETLYRKRLKQMEEEVQKRTDSLHSEAESSPGNNADVEPGPAKELTGPQNLGRQSGIIQELTRQASVLWDQPLEAGLAEQLTGSPKIGTNNDEHRGRWPPSIMSRERRYI
jgi:hypothetical protein